MMAREVPASKLHYLRLLEMVCRIELDMRELEKTIKQETAICYRLLRYLNSPLFGFSLEITSIRHAMAILGERELRRWIRLVRLVSAGQLKTSDLVLSALVRARFCELIARKIPRTQSDLFLVGMLSMMDAILDIPMAEVLEKIAIDQDTKSVLSGNGGRLQPVYELMLAQEAGNWAKAEASAATLRVSESEVGELWWQSMQWGRQVSAGK
jgi:EAL and modified HD-GYP domain-containing signal transduction protein